MARKSKAPRKVATVLQAHRCNGGPFEGGTIYLDAHSDGNTGWLAIRGEVGRYKRGVWEVQS